MYVVKTEKTKLTAKVQAVIDVCRAGGRVRYALENVWGGREQFTTRVLAADGSVVKGLGYRAAHDAIALGYLVSRPVPRSTVWAQEWVAAPSNSP